MQMYFLTFLEVRVYEVKIKVWAGLVPSGGSGEEAYSAFPASGGRLHSLACGPFAFHTHCSNLISVVTFLILTLSCLPPLYKDPYDEVGPWPSPPLGF